MDKRFTRLGDLPGFAPILFILLVSYHDFKHISLDELKELLVFLFFSWNKIGPFEKLESPRRTNYPFDCPAGHFYLSKEVHFFPTAFANRRKLSFHDLMRL